MVADRVVVGTSGPVGVPVDAGAPRASR